MNEMAWTVSHLTAVSVLGQEQNDPHLWMRDHECSCTGKLPGMNVCYCVNVVGKHPPPQNDGLKKVIKELRQIWKLNTYFCDNRVKADEKHCEENK